MHHPGTGKTVTTVLASAAVACMNTEGAPTLQLIVVPKSTLLVWKATFDQWTTMSARVVVAQRERDITQDALERATVVLTTSGVLLAAWKSFMCRTTGSHSAGSLDSWCRGTTRPLRGDEDH